MKLTFGKHEGKSVEMVILKEPDYAIWILNKEDASGALADIQKEVLRLINLFDSKPFNRKCTNCDRKATRFSFAQPGTNLYWWCDECDPHSVVSHKSLTIGKTYQEAMRYAKMHTRRVDQKKAVIRNIAQAKSLPNRVGEKQAEEFFKDA